MDAQAPHTTVCPECRKEILFQKVPKPNHLLLCPHCETILYVVSVRPFQLNWAFEEPVSPDELSYLRSDQKANWQFRSGYP